MVKRKNFKKAKKAWIKTVEAFVSVLIFLAIVLLVIGEKNKSQDDSNRIHDEQILILRYVELNESLRTEIINTAGDISWENFNASAPQTKNVITVKTPSYLSCEAKICSVSSQCLFDKTENKSVYAESILVTSNLQGFNSRVLKLFCWMK